jgi:hypothetical protein
MAVFHIQGATGPEPVTGAPYVAMIGDREARLFIHTECPLEGARLSCARSGLKLGNIAPLLLARTISREVPAFDSDSARDEFGAALLLDSLIAKHGAARLWLVMDRAPAIEQVPA